MKRTIITTIIVVVLASGGLMAFVNLTSVNTGQTLNFTEARRGMFEISVSGSGELIAEKYVDVRGPNIVDNFNFRAAALKITDLVPEGTIVKKGGYIATLDRSAFINTLRDEQSNLRNMLAEYDLKLLDTAVVLSTLRDDIKSQAYAVEEAAITVVQSQYDPPAQQRHSGMEYDKAKRHLEQKQRIYYLRRAQSSSDVKNLRNSLERQKQKVSDLDAVLAGFTITAPADGMVMYKRDRLGNKIKTGSVLHPFDPVVATLPDMSSLVSRTYVSEIDINKIKPGLTVQLSVDALQDKLFSGYVAGIANIGEQLSNSDSRVFEVLVRISAPDAQFRPTMSTSNKIIIMTYDDVVYIPLETLHTGADNVPFVYTRNGFIQAVVPGESNDRHIIIEKGLDEGISLFMTTPVNQEKFSRVMPHSI
jgi:multidrug efflux pump subunit AcrA (membrane-fusion protein)